MLRRLPFILLVLLLTGAPTPSLGQVMAFKQGEVMTGMTKQCIYNGLGNRYTLTLSVVSLCPLSVTVPSAPPSRPSPS